MRERGEGRKCNALPKHEGLREEKGRRGGQEWVGSIAEVIGLGFSKKTVLPTYKRTFASRRPMTSSFHGKVSVLNARPHSNLWSGLSQQVNAVGRGVFHSCVALIMNYINAQIWP